MGSIHCSDRSPEPSSAKKEDREYRGALRFVIVVEHSMRSAATAGRTHILRCSNPIVQPSLPILRLKPHVRPHCHRDLHSFPTRRSSDLVGVGEAALRDQADVFRNIGVGRAGPLAIHNSMVVIRMGGIGGFHSLLGPQP